MASALTVSMLSTLQATYNNANTISTPSDSPTLSQKQSYTNGAGANSATKLAYGVLTFTAGQTLTLDLSALTDPLGTAFSLVGVGVKGLFIINTTTTAGAYVTVTPSASNGWIAAASGSTYAVFSNGAHKFFIGAGGKFEIEAPVDSFAVPDGTHCKLDLFSILAATLNYAVWG